MADDLSSATFAGLIGEPFRVEVEGGSVELRLVGLKPAQAQGGFSIEFAGPSDHLLLQRIYRLATEHLEVPMIFLVPVGPGDDGLPRYEAVFN